MNAAANHDMFKLIALDKVPYLALGESDAIGELPWCLKPFALLVAHLSGSCWPTWAEVF